jgi:hypothetical protein
MKCTKFKLLNLQILLSFNCFQNMWHFHYFFEIFGSALEAREQQDTKIARRSSFIVHSSSLSLLLLLVAACIVPSLSLLLAWLKQNTQLQTTTRLY